MFSARGRKNSHAGVGRPRRFQVRAELAEVSRAGGGNTRPLSWIFSIGVYAAATAIALFSHVREDKVGIEKTVGMGRWLFQIIQLISWHSRSRGQFDNKSTVAHAHSHAS